MRAFANVKRVSELDFRRIGAACGRCSVATQSNGIAPVDYARRYMGRYARERPKVVEEGVSNLAVRVICPLQNDPKPAATVAFAAHHSAFGRFIAAVVVRRCLALGA
jgi:hypothetical protein